ncbi:MAG: redoxin domain-containing protein [Deltaproteobacteria bacterium]|nr:MAG: redoxin domain-containing protein [Deltaproteobacteria bacterium]
MNEFYQAIEERKDLKGKMKIIGIAIGNTPADVAYFKKKYEVPFPLFPDEDKSIYTALGKPKAPYFIGVKISEEGNSRIFYSKLGAFGKPDTFLASMLTLSGLE